MGELSLNVDEKVNDFSLEQAKGEDLAMKKVTENTKEEVTPECIDDDDDDDDKYMIQLSSSTEDYIAKLRQNFSHLKEKDLVMEKAKESVAEEEEDKVAFKDMDKLELSPSAEDFVSKLRNGLLNTPSLSR